MRYNLLLPDQINCLDCPLLFLKNEGMNKASMVGEGVVSARSKEVLEQVAMDCEFQGGKALVAQTDTTQEEQVNSLAAEAVARFGKVDVWVNAAAVSIFGAFQKIPSNDIRQVIETNLFGYIYGARAAVNLFCEQGWGTLINVSSVTGVVGQAYSTPYSATKFGIRGLSDSLGQELANKEQIRVCTVLPGVIDTPIYQHAANYTGKAINPPVSAVPEQKVAKVILLGNSSLNASSFFIAFVDEANSVKVISLIFPGLMGPKNSRIIFPTYTLLGILTCTTFTCTKRKHPLTQVLPFH